MHRPGTLVPLTALVLALGGGCSSPAPDPKVPRASQPAYTQTSEPADSPTSAGKVLNEAPDDLRGLDWARTAVPGDFCHVPGLIRFRSGKAPVRSDEWGSVRAEHFPDDVVYGDVVGDSRVEAALRVGCDTGGDTASGRLVWAYLVFTSEDGKLGLLGTITPQQYAGGQASSFESIDLARGRVTAHESWHRQADGVCCPSGKAVTVWRVGDDGTLEAGAPRVTA
ncbi:hypothetical protein [Streptomyces sp. NPDC004783]|uniref:hypothetical protein n=1 Tax=Streptomyces sp. NPDC004783 TaxID=3154459 RepID=UPI0033AD95BA